MIERFSKEDFEAALPKEFSGGYFDLGEWCYDLVLNNAKIVVRSSVDRSGYAGDTGDNSIRIYLMDDDNKFIINKNAKVIDYITRLPGWKERMINLIEKYLGIASQIPLCKVCNKILRVNIISKPTSKYLGRRFASCSNYNHDNGWNLIDDDKLVKISEYRFPVQKAKQSKQEQKFTPVIFKDTGRDLSRFTEHQLQVIMNLGNGAVVVDAGAGSGKTTVATEQIINMILNGVDPSRILVVTFTVEAAAEMRARIAKAVWPDISPDELEFLRYPNKKKDTQENLFEDVVDFNRSWIEEDPIRTMLVDWVCTIHALCRRLLVASGIRVNTLAGPPHEFIVKSLIKDSIDEFKWKRVGPKEIQYWIDTAIINDINPRGSEFWFVKEILKRGYFDDNQVPFGKYLEEIYTRYMKYVSSRNLYSFTMMQAEVKRRIQNDESFLDFLNNKFDYLICDEAQDTDNVQIDILFEIAKRTGNCQFIGDSWQSLYAFRGAKPKIMEEDFTRHWKNALRFIMPTNFRSAKNIVDRSKKLIKHNYIGREQYMKDVCARDDAPEGNLPKVIIYDDFSIMTESIATTLINDGNYGDYFIISRTRAECASIHTALVKHKIPCINMSGGMLIGASHIRKVMAYLRLAIDYNDARDDLEILGEIANVASDVFLSPNTRRRHLDTCSNDKYWVDCGCPIIAREGHDLSCLRYYGIESVNKAGSWDGIIRQTYERNKGGFPSMASKGASDLVYFVNRLNQFKDDALECINRIIEESVMPWLAHEEGVTDDDLGENGKTEDFDVLRQMVKPGQSVEDFLADMDDLTGATTSLNSDECVKIGTVHAMKGLERPKVILNMTRMPIAPPPVRPGQLPTSIPNTIEDERCIAYVGFTRAKDEVTIVFSCEWLGKETKFSQFINELELKEVV